MTDSYDQFLRYFNESDENRRKVYDKAVSSFRLTDSYEDFLNYAGYAPKRMTVEDVGNQNNPSVVTFDKNTTSFDDWYPTVPADRNDTKNYNLRRAYELAPAEELEAWRTATPEELERGEKHLRSVYENENGEYEFMKSKKHPTLKMELDWYNSDDADAVEFKRKYRIETEGGKYYKYVSRGLDLDDMSVANAAKNAQLLESVNKEISSIQSKYSWHPVYGKMLNDLKYDVKYNDLLYQQKLLTDYVNRLKGSDEYRKGVQEIHSFNDQFRDENGLVRGDAMSKLRKHNFNLFGASGNMFMLEKFMHMSNIDMNMLVPGQEDMYNDAAADFAIYGAEQKVRLAEDEIANGTGGFGTQFARGWRNSNWNKLDKQMTLNMALQAYKIAKKFDENGELLEGQTLSESETRLFKALQIAYLADNTVVETMWERIGENAPEQVKYTLEFILTSELMGASALSKGIAGAATRNIENKVAKKLVFKAVDYTAQPLLQTLYNPLNWMEGSIERQTGNLTYDENTGNFAFAGAQDEWTATRNAIVSAWIENFSEKIGEDIFKPIVKPLKYGNKKLRNMDNAFGSVYNQFATKIDVVIENAGLHKIDDVLKISKDIRLSTGVQGIPGEYVEEVVGGIMNAMFVGDQSFHQYDENGNPNPNYLWNSEQQLETFLSCAVMSIGMTTVSNIRNGAVGLAERRKAKSYLDAATKAMQNQGFDVDAIDKAFENGTLSQELFIMGAAENVTDDKRQILTNYIAAKINYKAMRHADMGALEEQFKVIEDEARASVNAETKGLDGSGGRIIQVNVDMNGEMLEGVAVVSGKVLTRIETDANGNDMMVLGKGSSSVLYVRVPGEAKPRAIYSSQVKSIVAATNVDEYIEKQKNMLTGMMIEMFGAQYEDGLPLGQLIAECAVLNDKEMQIGKTSVSLEKGRKYHVFDNRSGKIVEAAFVEDTQMDGEQCHVFNINGENMRMTDSELKESMLRYRLQLAEESGVQDEAAQIELDALLRERDADMATRPVSEDQMIETVVSSEAAMDESGNFTADSNPKAVAVAVLKSCGDDLEKAIASLQKSIDGLAAQTAQNVVSQQSGETASPSLEENVANANAVSDGTVANAGIIGMYQQAIEEAKLYMQNFVGEPEIGETYALTNDNGTVYGRFEGYDADGNVQYRETDESGENDGRLVVLPKNEFQKQRRTHNIEIQAQKPITIENAKEIAEETPVIPTETIAENAEENAVVPPVEETPVKEEIKLPRDKDNNIDYKQITDPALYAKGLTEEFGDDAQSVIDELIADEKKNLEKAGTKNAIERRRAQKAAQSSIDFYNHVKNTLTPKPSDDVKVKNVAPKDSKAFEKRIATAINEIGEPTSFEDEVLRRLANSSHQFKWGSDGTHKGMGATLGFNGGGKEMTSRAMFLNRNGKYFDEVALDIWQDLPEAYNENHTDQEVRDLMIDFLRSYSNPFEMVDAIRQMQLGARNGETIDEAADRQQEESIESIAASYGMTVDEFNEAVYKANELNMSLDEFLAMKYVEEEFLKEKELSDEDYENYTNFAAEQILTEEQGGQYDTGRTESDTELHQGEAETAQQGGIRPVVGESTGTGRERGNIGEEREVQQERDAHGSDELPDKGVEAEPYQPRSQRGKDRAVELDNAISAQRERVASARSEYDKAVGDFNKRNGLFGDTEDNDDTLFGDLADFSKENFERISSEKQTEIENEQKRLDELVSNRDKELREIDEAEDKQTALFNAEQEVDTNPTDAQKEAGNYKKGHVTIDGFDISIENPRGSVRSGVDENGNEWSVTMHDTYGYIRNTESVDGDHIDIFLSDHIGNWNGSVFVVDQVKPDGSFDEHKVMYGFDTEEEAREAYLANYSEGWQGLGSITVVSKNGFKKWIESSHRKTKPFREYRDVILNNKTVNENPSGNKLVTDAQYEELKKRMRDKLRGQANVGIDPEILSIGVQMAVYHIEKGARKFADYAKDMIADLGDVIRPYLKAFYNGARELPEVEEAGYAEEMTPYDEVKKFDVANFDKEKEDLGETISVVEQENKIEQDVEKINKENEKKTPKQSKNSLTLQQSLFDTQDDNELKEDNNGLQRVHELRSERLQADRDNGSNDNGRKSETTRQEGGRPDRGGEEGGMGRPRQGVHDRLRPSDQLAKPRNTHNNHAERGTDYAPKSVDARIEANIKAIELMQQLIESGEQATPEQMATLRQFSGWGGLGKAFTDNPYGYSPNARLKALLGEEAYEQANMSRNSAYYTPANVIDTLWDIAKALGFKGGNILEGSAGIGNILGLMPTEISNNSSIHAVEIDQTAGNILSLLYPDANVEVQGFEATKIENGSIDLAITNVPFVTGLRVNDTTGDKDLSKKFHDIHDFCIAKNIRKLREGGIGIFITSSGTLDNSARLREWIVSEGNTDVVGAFRLNNETFGGTGATSDIIVVHKRVNGVKSPNAIDVSDISSERVAEYKTGDVKKVKGEYIEVTKQLSMDYNAYYIAHPDMMAGKMYFGFEKDDYYRATSKALYPAGKNQNEMLANWAKSFSKMDWSGNQQAPAEATANVYESLGDNIKEGSMLVNKKGVLCVAQRGSAVPLDVNANKVKGHTKVECFNSYQSIKQALADVLDYQTQNDSDEGLQPLLDRLNRTFDSFIRTYGNLHRNTSITFLKNDVDYPNILALETFRETADANGNKIPVYGKTDVFTRRVVEKDKAPEPTNIKDGIIASIYLHGRVDIPYLSKQLNMSEDEVKNEIINQGLGFENPSSREIEVSYEYLSGNVREKLEQAIENNTDGRYNNNIKELEKVIPMTIPPHLIDFSIGSSWIEPQLYVDYIKDRTDIGVEVAGAGGSWFIKTPYFVNEQKNRTFGVFSKQLNKLIYGTLLIDAAMNNRTITVSETHKKYDGSTETIIDKEATQACANKIDEIRQDFKDWAKAKMQSDTEMSQRIERVYNDMFNNYVPKDIPDDFIPEYFGGATHNIKLEKHQAKAALRAVTQPLMLAHEVGAGKTYTLITTAMEMRRLGTAKKPMIVVQNATVGQVVESAKQLYPNAKVLTIEDKDHTGEGRKNFYAKIKYNDWDMIVVPQSVFERIPDSDERQMAFVQDKIEEKLLVLEQMRDADSDGNSMIVRQAEKELSQLETQKAEIGAAMQERRKKRDEKKEAVTKQNAEVKALEMLDRATDDVENFDDMGIDAILVDEAHEYKHLGFATAMQRGVKGVDPSYSKKAQGVFLKAQAVMEKNNGRNVVFATGTPISNTAAEIWTFMRYLMPADTMKNYGIYYFDDFVRNFGNLQQMLEFTTSGKFRENNRFAGYVNLPELVRIWSGVADTVTTSEIEEERLKKGKEKKIPDMEGGKAQDVYLPQTKALRSVMKYVKSKLEEYENMTGKQKKENSHIPLVMYGIAKAAAVDARLVVDEAEDDPNSKTNEAVRQILRSLDETKAYKGTVAVFADNYQNKHSKFNIYDDIKAKLVEAGIPENQIVVMRSGMSVKKKLEIFDKMNGGEVRVMMGSTFTLGTGVNIQERLHTLIHLDAPNRPMDYTQRNGRILRQGNLHKQMGKPVRVLRFGVEDSLDVTAYQRLKTKGAIADSIMNGKAMMINNMENRVLEEEEDVFGDTVAQLSGSEYAMLKNQAEKDVRKYEAKYKQWQADQIYVRNELPNVKTRIEYNKKAIADAKKALDTVKKAYNGNLDITIGKLKFNSIDGMKDFITEYNKSIMAAENEVKNANGGEQTRSLTININGIDFVVNTTVKYEMLQKGTTLSYVARRNMRYSCAQLGLEDIPVKQSLVRNAIDDIVYNIMTGKEFESDIQSDQAHLDRYEKSYEQLKQRDGKEFEYTAELEASRKRLDEYTAKMKEEMEEKEKKYAVMDAEVEAADNIIEADENDDEDSDDEDNRYSVRTEAAPKKTGVGYKVFVLKDGKLYPPMVANPNGEETPVGIWLNADAAPIAGESKTGRPQVKAGGKGTQGGSGQLAYRPGWHLGEIPYAIQFNRANESGEKTLFPKNFVWAEVEYANDVDYQEEAHAAGINANGKYEHRLAGLKRVPENGSYRYRTNPNPETDPWIITGAMKVNRILTPSEVDEIVKNAGRKPQIREDGAITDKQINELNADIEHSKQLAFDAVRNALAKAGIEVIEATDEEVQAQKEKVLHNANSTLMGWVDVDGKIHLSKSGMNAETAIHEYTHLWVEGMRTNNLELWEQIRDMLIKDNPMYDEIRKSPAYANIKNNNDKIAEEILARISGKQNAKRIEDAARKLMDENPGTEGAIKAASLIERLRDALNRFWTWCGKTLFGKKGNITVDQVTEMVLADLVNNVNPDNPNGRGNKAAKSVNNNFNEQLERLTPENADSVVLSLGYPSAILTSAGIADKPLKLYGNKLVAKAKKHGFLYNELKDLPNAVAKPMMIFHGSEPDSYAIFTEMRIGDKNVLVSVSVGKDNDVDFNLVSSVYGKNSQGVVYWINNNKTIYANKEKALDYLRTSAPIADARLNQEFISAAKIIQNFVNPTENFEKLSFEDEVSADTMKMNTAIISDILNKKLGIRNDGSRKKNIRGYLIDQKRRWMDSLDPLKKLQQSIAEVTGKPLADFEDAYNAELRRAAISPPMIERYTYQYLIPMIESVGDILKYAKDKGLDIDEKTLGLYLIAKHGLERNEYFKKLNDWKEVRDMSGLTALAAELGRADEDFTEVAKDFVKEIEDSLPKEMVDKMWSGINDTTNAILAKYLESGMISKKQYDEYKQRYNNYVPLRGWDETTSDEFYNYSVLDPHFQSAIKQAKGRTSLANNVLANIMNMTESAVVIGEKNKVLRRLFNLAQGRKNDVLKTQRSWYVKNQHGEWEEALPEIEAEMTPAQVKQAVDAFEENMKDLQEKGLAKQTLNRADVGVKIKQFNVHEHYVPVFINGRKHAIIINGNPNIVKSLTEGNDLKSDKYPEINIALDVIRKSTRFMSQLNTTYNPEFIVKNVMRDAGMAMISSYIEGGLKYANKVRSNINLFGYRYLGQLIRNGECDNTEITQYWKEFIDNGGETGFTRTLNVDEQAKRLKKMYKNMLSGKDVDRKSVFETLASAIDSFNRWGEDLSRFAVYVTNRQMGKTVEQSVNMAKNVTVNFQRKGDGALAAWFRTTRSFFNSGMQALYRFGSLAKNNPKRFAIASTAMVVSGLIVPALNILMLSLFGDKDDWETYESMSEFTGNHSWHLFVGNGFATLPYPQDFATFFAAGNIIFRHAIGWADKDSTIAGDIFNMALEQMPFDMGGGGSIDWKIMNAVTPQVLQPFVEVYINEDFIGRPIYKKNPFNENDPNWTKAFKSTSGTLVELAKRLNGNDPVMKHSKFWDTFNNPAAWQHILEGEAGGIGRIVKNLSRMLEHGFSADNMPFLRNLYMTSDMSKFAPQVTRDYYNLLNGFDEMKNNINGYDNDGESLYDNLDRYTKLKTSPEYKAYLATEDLTKTIKEKQDNLKLMQAYDAKDEDIETMRNTITSLQIMVLDITNNLIIEEGRPLTKEFRQVIDNIRNDKEE